MDWAGIVDSEGGALVRAARAAGEATQVPSCPAWTVDDLVLHAGMILVRTRVVLETGTMERPSRANGLVPDQPERDRIDWFERTLPEWVAALRAVGDPDRPVYTFAPEHQRAGFWPRRMAQEITVHRVDAELAGGQAPSSIDPALAVDGVDELWEIFVPALGADRSPGDGRTVHLHATDADGEWLVTFGPTLMVEHGHAKGDAAVRGEAGQLLLWLWGRVPLDDLEVFGDRSAAEALRDVTRF
jgi:uncharacterized protein (TIGR03083 family)